MALFGIGKKKDTIDVPPMSGAGSVVEPDDEGFPLPYLPSLSLVPQSRLSLLRRRRAVHKAVLLGLVCLGVIAVALGTLFVSLALARSALQTAQDNRDIAEQGYLALRPVEELYDGFEERQQAVAGALAADVDYYALIMAVEETIQAEIPRDELMQDPDGEWYVKEDWAHIGMTSYNVTASPCPSNEPFQPEPALGCIQGSAVSSSYTAAGEAITALNEADNGLFGGYVLSTADQSPVGDVGATSWTFSINFGAGALSGKYAEQSQAILGDGTEGSDVEVLPSPEPSFITEGEDE